MTIPRNLSILAEGASSSGVLAVTNGGTGVTTSTGTGSVVLSASPTLTGTLTVPTVTSPAATALTIQSAGTTAMTVDTSQNVGIGVTSPGAKLDVAGSIWSRPGNAAGALAILSADATSGANGASLSASFATGGYGPLKFLTANTEAMRIDTSGNVGIGTTSPSSFASKLAVQTADSVNTIVATAATALVRIGAYISSKSAGTIEALNTAQSAFSPLWFGGSILQFATSGTEVARIDSSGNLLVGYTTSNGSYKLQVNSQIFATSSTIATSDARYKQNVETLTGALDIVRALRPISFNWKEHPVHSFDTTNTTVGFLAQEVQEVLADKPYLNSIIKKNECVLTPEIHDENFVVVTPAITEEFLGIAEGNMIAILTAAIQELSTKNDALEARLAAIEASLAKGA